MISSITPVILTYNEAPNVGRTLEALAWAREIVVVDSGSDDATLELLRAYPGVRVFQRAFDGHASQWNFAISHTAISTDWILCLDADYVLTPALVEELRTLRPDESIAGYRAHFQYCVFGKVLRGSVYPAVTVLFRRGLGRYFQDGHTQRLALEGEVVEMKSPIRHDDRKPLAQWLRAQSRYTELEAAKLAATPYAQLTMPDRLRRMIFLAPPAMLVYVLIVRGALLDGRAGIYYAMQRVVAETILSLRLLERSIKRD